MAERGPYDFPPKKPERERDQESVTQPEPQAGADFAITDQGSQFKFQVDSVSFGYIADGPGLSHVEFGNLSICKSNEGAGAGGFTMAVSDPNKPEFGCHDNKDGTVSAIYLPTAPGEYKISVKSGDKHIKGSPFSAKITGSDSEVPLAGKASHTRLNASVQYPSGLDESCFLQDLPKGKLGISFPFREIGEHQVSVVKGGNVETHKIIIGGNSKQQCGNSIECLSSRFFTLTKSEMRELKELLERRHHYNSRTHDSSQKPDVIEELKTAFELAERSSPGLTDLFVKELVEKLVPSVSDTRLKSVMDKLTRYNSK